ncbi:MAG: DUF4159 domain-containing protein [Magnetococcus sp. WYHC-3]
MTVFPTTRPRRAVSSVWPSLLCAPLGILASGLVWSAARLPGMVDRLATRNPLLREPFLQDGIYSLAEVVAWCGLVTAVICFVASIVGFVRRPWTLRLVRAAYMACWAMIVLYIHAAFCASAVPLAHNITVAGITPTSNTQFYLRLDMMWPACAVAMLLALLYLFSWRRAAIAIYQKKDKDELPPAAGDRFIENVRTNGKDPPFRKGMWTSVTTHLMVIVVIPWLLDQGGCVNPYRVPKGSGTPEVNVQKTSVKVIKKKKKKRRLMVNSRAAISFYVPDLDDSKLSSEVDNESMATYVAEPSRFMSRLGTAKAGKMGAGGGKTGGWPDGMEDSCVRFIRMQYDGAGWDDGMDAVSRADLNFLDTFHELTDFKVATKPESHPIRLLRKYPKGFAPPFVYMTGTAGIDVSSSDIKIMREYLLDGGLLFASAASPQWGTSFTGFMNQVFPGQPLLVIADDDPLFQVPYSFPNGAPPLWHHCGTRVLGIKHNDRWVVYFHPGDVHDAWKTGHSGMDPVLAESATQIGINVIYYAFTHYLEMTRKYRQ